jgi:hypothetical protein
MFDSLNKFQETARAFDPMMLVVTGVVLVAVGIVVWLAGTRFTRIIAAVLGFIGGGIGGFYLFPTSSKAAAIAGAVIGALVAMVISRFILAVAGLAIFAMAGLFFAVGVHFSETAAGAGYESVAAPAKLSAVQTMVRAGSHAEKIAETMFSLAKRLPILTWPFFAAVLVAVSLVGMFFRRLMVAIGCSSAGTGMIFAGMISLLLFKGSSPLTYMYGRILFFFAVFAGMVVAGAVSQMILCRPPKLKILKEHEEIEKKKHNRGEHKWTTQQS